MNGIAKTQVAGISKISLVPNKNATVQIVLLRKNFNIVKLESF